MQVLIFGASGFIGSHLARYMNLSGHRVMAFCRTGAVNGFNGECIKWSLESSLENLTIENMSCAIHLAHDFSGIEGAQLTREKTLANIEKLESIGVKKQLFFSSYSAGEHATSIYGQIKLAIEKSLVGKDEIAIVRPGLVLGDGGIYERMRKCARYIPIIPLPGGGRGKVPTIGIEKLCQETLAIVEASTLSHEYNLFEPELSSLREIVIGSVSDKKYKPWIIPVPISIVTFLLRCASIMRLPLPINIDNLEGFIANQKAEHTSTL